MNFVTLPRVYPEMAMWGAAVEPYSFVISRNDDDQFIASVKRSPSTPFVGERTDLGAYDTFSEAENACEQWLKAQRA